MFDLKLPVRRPRSRGSRGPRMCSRHGCHYSQEFRRGRKCWRLSTHQLQAAPL